MSFIFLLTESGKGLDGVRQKRGGRGRRDRPGTMNLTVSQESRCAFKDVLFVGVHLSLQSREEMHSVIATAGRWLLR